MSFSNEVSYFEMRRKKSQDEADELRIMRDGFIYLAFESGERQKKSVRLVDFQNPELKKLLQNKRKIMNRSIK